MRLRNGALSAFVALFAFLWSSCERDAPVIPNIFIGGDTITNNNGQGGGGTGPSGPSGPGGSCPLNGMPVRFFGYHGCSNPPNNSSGILPLDCIADATATPRGLNGQPAPPEAHGFNITWRLEAAGAGRARVVVDDNPFNAEVIPDLVGTDLRLVATLVHPSCTTPFEGSWAFKVVASGARSGSVDQFEAQEFMRGRPVQLMPVEDPYAAERGYLWSDLLVGGGR